MFDISWTEFLLIGVVALIVIGPKELPAVLRTLGQYTRKVRSMAADFQGQFQEAMREAEMADLKKSVDDIATGIKAYDPLKDVRADLESTGKDIQSSLEKPTAATSPDGAATATGPVAPEAAENSTPAIAAAEADTASAASVTAAAAATGPVAPEAVKAAEPESAERAG